jgi:hypothetical protein
MVNSKNPPKVIIKYVFIECHVSPFQVRLKASTLNTIINIIMKHEVYLGKSLIVLSSDFMLIQGNFIKFSG